MADWTSSVRSYLRSTLLTVSNLPAVAYEGRAYTPVIGTAWVRERLMPTDAMVATLGSGGQVREDFLYRLTVFSPFATLRLTDHEDLVDRIRAKFFPGQTVRDVNSTIFGTVIEVRRGTSLTEPDWISTPITISAYFYRATRAA